MTTPPFPWDADAWDGFEDDDAPEEPWSATFETDAAAELDETDDWPEWNCGPMYRMWRDLLNDEESGGETEV